MTHLNLPFQNVCWFSRTSAAQTSAEPEILEDGKRQISYQVSTSHSFLMSFIFNRLCKLLTRCSTNAHPDGEEQRANTRSQEADQKSQEEVQGTSDRKNRNHLLSKSHSVLSILLTFPSSSICS